MVPPLNVITRRNITRRNTTLLQYGFFFVSKTPMIAMTTRDEEEKENKILAPDSPASEL